MGEVWRWACCMVSFADASSGGRFGGLAEPPAPVHGLRVSRGATLFFGASFVLTVAWAGAATWLIAFGDDLAARLIERQTEMQFAYEDRLGALRARLERVVSRELLSQDDVEHRLSELLARQAQIETRQAIVATLAEHAGVSARTPSLVPAADATPLSPAPDGAVSLVPLQRKPMPLADAQGTPRENGDGTPIEPGPRAALGWEGSLETRLASSDRSIRAVERSQLAALEGLAGGAQRSLSRLNLVLAEAGLDGAQSAAPAAPRGGVGGPFVPVKIDPGAGPFERSVDRLQRAVLALKRARQVVADLPLARPMPWEAEITSGFGVRVDPFTRAAAMHTGIDLKAEPGTPVRATGGGRVVTAEYAGGYGNMVEVEHPNGITTRYAHLSSIAVEEEQAIPPGAVIGRVGSTGRSTGAHLHYETRLAGEPVDPQRFLRAGARLRE